jgi:acyl-[acyl carrier protein]--UDP-N-acetylglucosamine O-acyltransferase
MEMLRLATINTPPMLKGYGLGEGGPDMTIGVGPHDAVIGDEVTTSPFASIGGSCEVHEGATIGMHAAIHQQLVIGAHSMIAMNASITKHVQPFQLVIPGIKVSLNTRKLASLDIEASNDHDLKMLAVTNDYVNALFTEYDSARMTFPSKGEYHVVG